MTPCATTVNPFDWTSPCDRGPCDGDSCHGSVLTSCARGGHFEVDCAVEQLGGCGPAPTAPGRMACAPP
jgi:hypothetical protein